MLEDAAPHRQDFPKLEPILIKQTRLHVINIVIKASSVCGVKWSFLKDRTEGSPSTSTLLWVRSVLLYHFNCF